MGGGWNAEEIEDHGTAFKTRFKLMRERIEAMKEIWTRDKAEYHGEFVDFPTMMTWPKPAQKPYPPIIVGGAFPHAARRAIRYGNGWVPIAGRAPYGDVNEYLPKFKQMAAEAGRSPDTLPITLFGGTEDADLLKRYREMGVERVVTTLHKSDLINEEFGEIGTVGAADRPKITAMLSEGGNFADYYLCPRRRSFSRRCGSLGRSRSGARAINWFSL